MRRSDGDVRRVFRGLRRVSGVVYRVTLQRQIFARRVEKVSNAENEKSTPKGALSASKR